MMLKKIILAILWIAAAWEALTAIAVFPDSYKLEAFPWALPWWFFVLASIWYVIMAISYRRTISQ